MAFSTSKAFMLRDAIGKLGEELPSDIKELLKERGLTVVFVSGDVECDGEYAGLSDTMFQQIQSEVM
jgi:hypothetical protein